MPRVGVNRQCTLRSHIVWKVRCEEFFDQFQRQKDTFNSTYILCLSWCHLFVSPCCGFRPNDLLCPQLVETLANTAHFGIAVVAALHLIQHSNTLTITLKIAYVTCQMN